MVQRTLPCRVPDAVAAQLVSLPLWTLEGDAKGISREFVFADFVQAFAFMGQVASAAQAADHHPEWSNVYNRVRMTWTTHDAQGLTQADVDMARTCDRLYAMWSAEPTL